jgi:hypothetical protein
MNEELRGIVSADEIQHQLIRLDTLVRLHFDQDDGTLSSR